jgi:hypothetical protein
MSDYELYYWPVPFRGQFVRVVLAYAGCSWTEAGDAAILRAMSAPADKMPVPFMGPPLLIDKKADVAIAQMPAIMLYLGETLDLMPATPALRALTMKVVNDANDVIDEITQHGGQRMWTKKPGANSCRGCANGCRSGTRPAGAMVCRRRPAFCWAASDPASRISSPRRSGQQWQIASVR